VWQCSESTCGGSAADTYGTLTATVETQRELASGTHSVAFCG
jgi:hypothetical protein